MLDAEARLVDRAGRDIVLGDDVVEAFRTTILDLLAGGTDDLTIQQAARLIGMSRPVLLRLLDRGTIASHRTNGQRRVALTGALAYLRADLARRRSALDNLAADAEAFGLFN